MSVDPEAEKRIVARINAIIGKDVKQLKCATTLADQYKVELQGLKEQLNYESDNTSSYKMALDAEKRNYDCIEIEMHKMDALADKMRKQIQKFTVVVVDSTQSNLEHVRKLQLLVKYLDIVEEIQKVNSDLITAMNDKNDSNIINMYLSLYEPNDKEHSIIGRTRNVDAPQLQKFANCLTCYWYARIKEHLSEQLSETMKLMHWGKKDDHPLIITYDTTPETIATAQLQAEYLFLLQSPKVDQEPLVTITAGLVCQPLSTVTQVLLQPYRQRFLYHFTGTRKTNRLDKPEWMYTQILNWGKEAHIFVGQTFQQAALKAGKVDFNIRLEFLRGLVQLVVEKLATDIDIIYRESLLFAHLLDETLSFEVELRETFGYPAIFPSAISVLTQPFYLMKWIALEEAFCEEKIDNILQNDMAWTVIDPHCLDEELKIPVCVDQFVRLLDAIKQRYFALIQPGQQLQFLSLQLQLIDSFRRRLVQLHNSDKASASSVLNAVNYLVMVLRDWGENVHYLHLHTALVGTNTTEINSVFDEAVTELDEWQSVMISHYANRVVNDVKARSMIYRHDCWASMPEHTAKEPFILSPSSGEMFHVMLMTLHSLHQELSTNIFNRIARHVARIIDDFLFDSLVMTSKFSTGGAEQFKYDMTRNLFMLFGQYIRRSELLFKKLNNSAIVLTIPRGTALLLHETLLSEQQDAEEKQKALQELGITDFSSATCIDVLERRTDIKAFSINT